MAGFIWGSGGAQLTPEEIASQRKVAQSMMQAGSSYDPVKHWTQGAARVAQAMSGGLLAREANEASRANEETNNKLIAAMMGQSVPAPAASTAAEPAAGIPPVSAPMGQTKIPVGKEDFVTGLMPLAQEASAKTGVDPRVIIAQAAVESGWGKSAPGGNLFGIKSHGQPGGNVLPTSEVVNGQPVQTTDSFRAYASPADSVNDYADFINRNPRYAALKQAPDLESQIAALGASGYASDPGYANKVGSIARGLPTPGGNAQAQPTQAPVQVAQAQQPALNPALIRGMASPYVSDGTKKVLGILLQNQLKDSVPTNDMRELAAINAERKGRGEAPLGLLEYQTKLKEAGKPVTTIDQRAPDEFEKEYGQGMGKRALSVIASGDKAATDIQNIGLLNRLLTDIQTGKLAQTGATIGSWMQSVGLDPAMIRINPALPATAEAATALINKFTLGSIGGEGGMPANNFSNTDRDFITRIQPSLANRPEANQILLEAKAREAQLSIERADKWAEARENKIPYEKFERQWRKELSQRNVFGDLAEKASALSAAAKPANVDGWQDMGGGVRIREKK